MPYFFIDKYYLILVLPTIIIALIAQVRVKSAYSKYAKVPNSRGITGAQAARAILDAHSMSYVSVAPISGQLTDNFNPSNNVISLSQGVYDSASIAAVGIAAHEAGHAVQHHEGYSLVKIRTAIVPVVNFAAGISWYVIIAGLIFSLSWLAQIGLILMFASTLFHLVTLPVELNASKRAIRQIEASGLVASEELAGVKTVLRAAAMTYIAALLTSVMSLLRMVLIVRGRNNR